MLCPNCGTKTTNDYKFCRNCGMNLEPVSKAVAAHLAPGGAASAAAARASDRRAVRRTTRGLLTGIIVVLFGVFMMAVPLGNAFQVLGLMSALLGIVFVLVTVLSTMRVSAPTDVAPTPPPPRLPDAAAPTGRLLDESRIEPVPSVTDHTTELLGVEVKGRNERK
jgi:hypothetical protein